MKNIIVLVAFVFIAISCEFKYSYYGWNIIDVVNNSDSAISIIISKEYPDTTFPKEFDDCQTWTDIGPHRTVELNYCVRRKHIFEKQRVLQAFIIKYGLWYNVFKVDSIKQKDIVLKRYQFTKQELEKANWTIIYP